MSNRAQDSERTCGDAVDSADPVGRTEAGESGRRRFTSPRRLSRRAERGATIVEYALLMAALVVPTIVAINYVQDSAQTEINRTATGISSKTIPPVPTTPGG